MKGCKGVKLFLSRCDSSTSFHPMRISTSGQNGLSPSSVSNLRWIFLAIAKNKMVLLVANEE